MAGQEKRQRYGKSEYQDQKRIDPQHHDQGTEDHDGTGAGLDQILRHGSVDGINIIGLSLIHILRWNLKEAGCGNKLTTGKSLV